MAIVQLIRAGGATINVDETAVANHLALGWRLPDLSNPVLTNADGTLTQVGRNFIAVLATENPSLIKRLT